MGKMKEMAIRLQNKERVELMSQRAQVARDLAGAKLRLATTLDVLEAMVNRLKFLQSEEARHFSSDSSSWIVEGETVLKQYADDRPTMG